MYTDVRALFNFPTDDFKDPEKELQHHMSVIAGEMKQSFKINLAIGFIMKNIETDELRYYTPYSNNFVLDQNRFISKATYLTTHLKPDLLKMNLEDYLKRMRPSSKWKPVYITNIQYDVSYVNYPLGNSIDLPGYIVKKKCIVTMQWNPFNGHKYTDDLCLFRCLAYHRGFKDKDFECQTHHYYKTWDREVPVQFANMDAFEHMFKIKVKVYRLNSDGSCTSVYYNPIIDYEDVMYVNVYESHLSYIKDIEVYTHQYKCSVCHRVFERNSNRTRHEKVCVKVKKLTLTGGTYFPAKNLREELDDATLPFYPYFIFWDSECMLIKEEISPTDKLTFTQRHVPVSISVCSNVPGFREALCLVEVEVDVLLSRFIEYMEEIRRKAFSLLDDRLVNKKDDVYQKRIDKYCQQIPVLGFNSSRYDIPVLINKLPYFLNLNENVDHFVIKKTNSFMCIDTPQFKFLDLCNYLAPGCSYSQFLKAYNTEEQKSFFPYDFFDGPEKLYYPRLPDYECFYSELKKAYVCSIEEYEGLLKVWSDQSMEIFQDYLMYYNNLDTSPAIEAIEKMLDFYSKSDIDIFKESVSAPGIARKLLFKSCDKIFCLIDKHDLALYKTFKANLIGGPSIVFKRYAERGITKIRDQVHECQKVIGLDCNSLYLWSIEQEQPSGFYVKRSFPSFKPEPVTRYLDMFVWMDSFKDEKIRHKLNEGKEKRIGPYYLDGWCEETDTGYEYYGCYFHGHSCYLTKNMDVKLKKTRYERTLEREKILKKEIKNLVTIWECRYKRSSTSSSSSSKNNVENNYLPRYYQNHPHKQGLSNPVAYVLNPAFFGAVEVDIEVPDDLKSHFQEMSPLFVTSAVSFEDIGEHMQEYTESNHLSKHPKRLLIGGMKASKLFLSSPLLRWYVDHGLVITHVYKLIEFEPARCFADFVDEISKARRLGDAHPDRAIIGTTMKLLGNSAYGSTIMNKENHCNIKYVANTKTVQVLANRPQFKKIRRMYKLYEITSGKQRIKLNTPIQVGYFILQYAKLRMLAFYYDCLLVHIPRNRFELIEMDTDSAYMAIAGESLDDVMIKNRDDYLRAISCTEGGRGFFPRTCECHSSYDKRTQGLFKLEATGVKMIALCSKCYFLKENDARYKMSCKGVQQRRVENVESKFDTSYFDKTSPMETNMGFRERNQEMHTYRQKKRGFSYEYWKRRVSDDGNHTEPLSITLSPWMAHPGFHLDDTFPLGMKASRLLFYKKYIFQNIFSLYEFKKAEYSNRFEAMQNISSNGGICLEPIDENLMDYEWLSEKRKETMMSIIRLRQFSVPLQMKVYYISKDLVWGCGFNTDLHHMFAPLEYPGRNLYGELIEEVYKTHRF